MAQAKIPFILVSPERLLRETQVEMVVIPGKDGDFGVLSGHAPLMSALRAGTIAIFENGKVTERLFISEGFAEINPQGCTILAESAENIADFDLNLLENDIKNLRDEYDAASSESQKNAITHKIEIAKARITATTHPVYA